MESTGIFFPFRDLISASHCGTDFPDKTGDHRAGRGKIGVLTCQSRASLQRKEARKIIGLFCLWLEKAQECRLTGQKCAAPDDRRRRLQTEFSFKTHILALPILHNDYYEDKMSRSIFCYRGPISSEQNLDIFLSAQACFFAASALHHDMGRKPFTDGKKPCSIQAKTRHLPLIHPRSGRPWTAKHHRRQLRYSSARCAPE
ncbi:hypothetical protein SAMN04488056_11552 [Cohaesibacter marisflavi]|uniref:Uncharacterized protein n=1 Tax=Cohaesibacter marisflavi TaxID=655353 RepID=A0A1I5KY08_9HYPH|nr:hypothetical protein SAMN04488056_11552 [Cohaesibacter marisflavi]